MCLCCFGAVCKCRYGHTDSGSVLLWAQSAGHGPGYREGFCTGISLPADGAAQQRPRRMGVFDLFAQPVMKQKALKIMIDVHICFYIIVLYFFSEKYFLISSGSCHWVPTVRHAGSLSCLCSTSGPVFDKPHAFKHSFDNNHTNIYSLLLFLLLILDQSPILQFHSGYQLSDLAPVVRKLYITLSAPPDEKLKAVRNKYSHK